MKRPSKISDHRALPVLCALIVLGANSGLAMSQGSIYISTAGGGAWKQQSVKSSGSAKTGSDQKRGRVTGIAVDPTDPSAQRTTKQTKPSAKSGAKNQIVPIVGFAPLRPAEF